METTEHSYKSSEIHLRKTISLNEGTTDLVSHDRNDLMGMDPNISFLLRDFILCILYWFSLYLTITGAWYLLWLLLWFLSIVIGLICHMYYTSPPFYSLYRGSDIKYDKHFDESAAEYITEWNDIGSMEPSAKETLSLKRQRRLTIKLCWMGTFGGVNESQYGFVELKAKNIENRSNDIVKHIAQHKNKLLRLRVHHILRFHDHDSYHKFITIFKDKRNEFPELQRAGVEFHIEYNVDSEERLLMNTTQKMSQESSTWNDCCSNRNLSYIWYILGLGFFYRFYHEYAIKTHIYYCIKEVTL